jgi:hypothetical protein
MATSINSYRRHAEKSNLKILAGGAGKQKQLRASGLEPDDTMAPGEYVASCTGAALTSKGKTTIAVLEFQIVDGPRGGTALRQWITIPEVDGQVPVGSRYARQCAIALGREIEPGDNLDPGALFPGKLFAVDVGYRKTERIGGQATGENALRRKDAKDFLRVHQITARHEELP